LNIPPGFGYAFSKLEPGIEELVGAAGIKERLDAAFRQFFMLDPGDFPEPLSAEYESILESLSWLPGDEGKGTAETTIDAMSEEQAAALAKRLFSFYVDAAEIYFRR
jgi:hypothetical protein